VAEMKDEWLENVLDLVPTKLKKLDESVLQLSAEMREDYHLSVKKAIVDSVLKDPREKSEYELMDKDQPEHFLK
jgi:dynein heavy chain, axonemal